MNGKKELKFDSDEEMPIRDIGKKENIARADSKTLAFAVAGIAVIIIAVLLVFNAMQNPAGLSQRGSTGLVVLGEEPAGNWLGGEEFGEDETVEKNVVTQIDFDSLNERENEFDTTITVLVKSASLEVVGVDAKIMHPITIKSYEQEAKIFGPATIEKFSGTVSVDENSATMEGTIKSVKGEDKAEIEYSEDTLIELDASQIVFSNIQIKAIKLDSYDSAEVKIGEIGLELSPSQSAVKIGEFSGKLEIKENTMLFTGTASRITTETGEGITVIVK